ncbi:GIY-YIG nuclease family protein [Paraliobacillus ryukyuensis]|uniref:GIY-YIG nuclease family protein n=1 Tax=Paraliobacillus ryukyuensis TaxID=200904 RepID=UPI0009A6C741|nr:GIY-YIG nuclease family protein [Paraliobacillus ryukyuensis]
MERIVGIYKVTNLINGKMYIGQSTNIKKRFTSHKNAINRSDDDPRGQGPLYDDMRNYGVENFSFEVMEECSKNELNEKEEYYISFHNSVDDGYNISKKAITTNDPDVRKKIITEEFLERNSIRFKEMNKQNWKDAEYRKKKSKQSSELQKKRLQDPEYRKQKSEQLKKYWSKKKKRVAQYTLDGELVAVYEGLRVAERNTGIKSIHKHLKEPDKRKQAGGYVWKYVDNSTDEV